MTISTLRNRTPQTLLFAAILILAAGMTAAQSTQRQSNHGLVSPSSPFYGLDLAFDNAGMALGIKSRERVMMERADEAKLMVQKNNTKGTEKALRAMNRVTERATERDEKGLAYAEEVLGQVRERANSQQRQGIDNAISRIEQNRQRSQNRTQNQTECPYANTSECEPQRDRERDQDQEMDGDGPDRDRQQDQNQTPTSTVTETQMEAI